MSDFTPTSMSHGDFFIGCEFMTGSGKWRCTDMGTRVITDMSSIFHELLFES
jgi:hypothetical protein